MGMARRPIPIKVKPQDLAELRELLRGGVQQVRVVLRTLALRLLAVYEKPYNPAEPVVCLDEKPVSLHADVRPPIPAFGAHQK